MVDKQAIKKSLGKYIKQRREAIDIRQEELAFRANLSMRYISRLKTASKHQPP
ncbi:helix-turn-helix domain-containing protein [Anaerobacillus sp. MEB173]|uniref:helix-turn-helix domain-containing protein n=1 Tax=Anaerobacillus sp. MEB173 TaxID=3383345 RepID=UPI003F9396A9